MALVRTHTALLKWTPRAGWPIEKLYATTEAFAVQQHSFRLLVLEMD